MKTAPILSLVYISMVWCYCSAQAKVKHLALGIDKGFSDEWHIAKKYCHGFFTMGPL